VEKLLIFAGMALVTYFTRYAMIAALSREMPPLLRRWLAYVPPAILAAVIAPAALMPRGSWEIGPHMWAMVVGGLVVWRTRNILLTILSGMVTFWILMIVWG
jgi:branched-subunit amino acid transport protein